ncbi:MAG: radical SAM protein [Oscillospiraceae bacterium]|nr:radical SAM protein [Oscillospiraceae bacterium]
MCSFCDQRAISGEVMPPAPEDIAAQCRESLESGIDGRNSEIAFFGGSFTAIPREHMLAYLEAVQPFLGENGFSGVRISTRPDAVPDEILRILKEYGVTAIELGAQSMSDRVLTLNRRGHSAQDVREASERIKAHGFSLGLQMMYGLYGSHAEDEEYTLSECIRLQPDTMRIYPTVVLDGTHLGELYKSGKYILPSWDDMLSFTADARCRLREEGISLIRLGLHAEKSMESRILSGFYHPSLRELAEERLYLSAMKQWAERNKDILRDNAGKSTYVLAEVQTGRAGLAAGHGKANRKAFAVRMRISENSGFSDGIIRLSLCISDETGTVKRIGEEVYDVFKITGTSGL